MLSPPASYSPDTAPRHIASAVPGVRFEWHPASLKLYLVRIGAMPEIGELVAHPVPTHGAAINLVLIFGRGHKEANRRAVP